MFITSKYFPKYLFRFNSATLKYFAVTERKVTSKTWLVSKLKIIYFKMPKVSKMKDCMIHYILLVLFT